MRTTIGLCTTIYARRMVAESAGLEDVRTMAADVLRSWDFLYAREDLETQLRGWTISRIAVVLGLAAHTHALGTHAFGLLERDVVLPSAPLVRSMFECALTAQWVAQVDGAHEAFLAQQARQKRTLLASVDWLPNFTADPAEVERLNDLIDESNARGLKGRTSFENICNSLEPGGPQAYAHYRIFSALSHPSDILLDHYFGRTTQGLGIARRSPPEQPSLYGTSAFALASLVWAGQAIEYRLPGRPRRALLRSVAKRLGIEPVLKPVA